MLKIHKGNMVLEVPKGSFKSIYGPSGWAVVEDNPVEPPQEPSVAPGEAGGSKPTSDPDTTPEGLPEASSSDQASDEDTLAQMSEDELRQYASLLGIKVKDLKTREKLMEAIKAHQE